MARNRIVEQVSDGAENAVREAGQSLLGRSMGMVKGAFGGLFSGTLIWGGIAFALQATGLIRPIANAIGGEELVQTVSRFGLTDQGVDNIGRRLAVSAGIGALMGSAGGAASGLLSNPQGETGLMGKVVGIGTALVAAAVVVGSVKNGNWNLNDTRDFSAPVGPRASRPAAAPTPNA
jgi:hypothetical protein